MSSEFTLSLIVQIQNEMRAGLAEVNSGLTELKSGADAASNSTSNLATRTQGAGTNFVQLGLGIASAAAGVISLVTQYHGLQKAGASLKISQNRLENANLNVQKAQAKLAEAIKKHGKNSKEAKAAQDALTKAENAQENAVTRLNNQQVSLNDRMRTFAITIIPSVIGVMAGLAQVFSTVSAGGGIGGFGVGLLKLAAPLAIIGGLLLAFKTNFLGFQDIILGIGAAIGNTIPALQPFLNFLKNAAIVFGLMPGNVDAAKLSLTQFLGEIKKWAGQVMKEFDKIAKMITSGDFLGAFAELKKIVLNIAFQIGQIKIGGFTLEQWKVALPILIKNKIVGAGGNLLVAIPQIIIAVANVAFGPETVAKVVKAVEELRGRIIVSTKQSGELLGTTKRGLVYSLLDAIMPGVGQQAQNWASTQIGLFKVSFKQNFIIPIKNFFNDLKNNPAIIIDWAKTILGKTINLETQFIEWFVPNVGVPLANAFNSFVKTVQDGITENPIFKAGEDIVNSILGTVALTVEEIRNQLDILIWQPLNKAWTDFKADVVAFFTSPANSIMTALGGAGEAFKKLFGFQGAEAATGSPFGMISLDPTQIQNLQTALANLSNEGIKSIDALANAVFNQTLRMNSALITCEVAAQKLQTGLANLSNQGVNSLNLLAAGSSSAMGGMRNNLSVGEVAAQKLQTGLANLSNQGSNSLARLASASSGSMSGLKNNLKTGEVAAQKLQTGLANLSNQGIKSMNALASASSRDFGGLMRNAQQAQRAVISLIKSIGNLHSKSITIHVGLTGPGVRYLGKGGTVGNISVKGTLIGTGGLISAAKGITTNGPTMLMVGDNPGGHETIAAIPHDNPKPTVNALNTKFGAGDQPIIVNVFLDGEQVRGKIVQAIVKGQAAYR